MRVAIIIALVFAAVSWACAQDDYTVVSIDQETVDPSNLPVTQEYRTTPMTLRKFDREKWRKVIGDTDYSGTSVPRKKRSTENSSEQSRNAGDRGDQRAWAPDDDDEAYEEEGSAPPVSVPWGGPFLKVLFYTIIIVLIAMILMLILRNIRTGEKVRKPAPEVADTEVTVENIEDLDIDSLLRQAGGNYRLAVRLYFLGLLQKLHEKGVIQWKKDKTNREYLMEVYTRAVHYPEVKKLTLAYEQVWYGDHAIETERYNRLQEAFRTLDQELNTLPQSEKR